VPKVLMLLTNGFEPDVRIYKQAIHFVRRGCSVTIFCWDRSGDLPMRETIDGINVYRCQIASEYGTGFRQLPAFFRFMVTCINYVNTNSWDILHCSDMDTMLIAFFRRQAQRGIWIFDMHEFYDSGTLSMLRFVVNPLVKFLCNKAAYVIYLNELQLAYATKRTLARFIYLPNYPELSKFASIKQQLDNKLRISYIGAVRQYSVLEILLRECYSFKDDVDVNIHGNGVDAHAVRELTIKMEFGTSTGKFTHDDIGRLYANTDLLFCVYDYNDRNARRAYATKLYEAIVACCPVIVQSGTVMADFVREHNIGFCVNTNIPGEITQIVSDCLQDSGILPKLRGNIDRINHNFAWENVVSNLDVVFQKHLIHTGG